MRCKLLLDLTSQHLQLSILEKILLLLSKKQVVRLTVTVTVTVTDYLFYGHGHGHGIFILATHPEGI